MLFDCHSHTKFSADSKMDIETALASAKSKHIGLITTEHVDFNFPGDDLYEFSPSAYFSAYNKYKRAHNLLLGVEIGMQEQTVSRSEKFAESSPFDMIIVSEHVVEGYDIYFPEYYQNKTKEEAYSIYLKDIASLLLTHSFGDVLGHIDYICRKAPYADRELRYSEFSNYIDKIWAIALTTNIIPEINTRRFDNPLSIAALIPIYKRYHEMGGRFATIGSDAHRAEAIGHMLPEASQFLHECGLTPVYFKQHKLISID